MIFYKILADGKVLDVNDVFLRWQPKHGVMLVCDPAKAEFICPRDCSGYYHPSWLNKPARLTPKKSPRLNIERCWSSWRRAERWTTRSLTPAALAARIPAPAVITQVTTAGSKSPPLQI